MNQVKEPPHSDVDVLLMLRKQVPMTCWGKGGKQCKHEMLKDPAIQRAGITKKCVQTNIIYQNHWEGLQESKKKRRDGTQQNLFRDTRTLFYRLMET